MNYKDHIIYEKRYEDHILYIIVYKNIQYNKVFILFQNLPKL